MKLFIYLVLVKNTNISELAEQHCFLQARQESHRMQTLKLTGQTQHVRNQKRPPSMSHPPPKKSPITLIIDNSA